MVLGVDLVIYYHFNGQNLKGHKYLYSLHSIIYACYFTTKNRHIKTIKGETM